MSTIDKDVNGTMGGSASGDRIMSTAIENRSSERIKKAVQSRWARMGKEDLTAFAELMQIILQDSGEDLVEVWDAAFELLFPEALFKSFDVADDEDQDARARVDAYRKKVGEMIRDVRLTRGMTQEELAEAAGLPQSHISRLECGKHTATHITIERIAEALETKPCQLDPGFD